MRTVATDVLWCWLCVWPFEFISDDSQNQYGVRAKICLSDWSVNSNGRMNERLERTGFEVVKRSRSFTFCGVISLIEINGLNKRSYLCMSGEAISSNFWVNSAIPISLTLRWKFPRDIWIPNPAMILWQIPHPADIWIPNPATILEPIPYPATKKGLIPHPAKPHRGPLIRHIRLWSLIFVVEEPFPF